MPAFIEPLVIAPSKEQRGEDKASQPSLRPNTRKIAYFAAERITACEEKAIDLGQLHIEKVGGGKIAALKGGTAMEEKAMGSLGQYFARLRDPREGQNIQYPLFSILSITICAVICGADNWVEVAMFGETKQDWLKTFLALPHGIPSHDTTVTKGHGRLEIRHCWATDAANVVKVLAHPNTRE